MESGKEDLKMEEGLKNAAKDPWAEMAQVSCSNEHMLSQPQLPAVTVLPPLLLLFVV